MNLKKYGDKFSKAFTVWFGKFLRRYITEDKKIVFHSFRHGFHNSLKQQLVRTEIIDELVGHGHNESQLTLSGYSEGYIPNTLKINLEKIDYGIDVVKILKEQGIPDWENLDTILYPPPKRKRRRGRPIKTK
jgi:hypothetical protein